MTKALEAARDDIVDRLYRLDADHCGVINAFGEAAREIERLRALLERDAPMREALLAYRQWEADLIEDDNAWERRPDGLPSFTDELWDRLLDIQAMREAALAQKEERR